MSLCCPFFFFSLIFRPPRSILFPYTTLFRSIIFIGSIILSIRTGQGGSRLKIDDDQIDDRMIDRDEDEHWKLRSEEHTSELQSRFDLVCRLLLEKKKNRIK